MSVIYNKFVREKYYYKIQVLSYKDHCMCEVEDT